MALLFAALTALAASQTTASSDPCEGYGDCLSASLTYLRANPDNSLYLGDSFQISLAISYGPNTVGSQTSWAYDTAAFSANTTSSQAEFRTLVNGSSAYAISASVTFTVVICTTSNGVTTCADYYPTLRVQETVQTRAFELQLTTEMSNFTDSQGYLLRNPDGSFFHDDEFYVNYTYGFLFMQQRPDIRVVVEPQFDPSFVKLTAYQNSSSTGYFLFTVGQSHRNLRDHDDRKGVQLPRARCWAPERRNSLSPSSTTLPTSRTSRTWSTTQGTRAPTKGRSSRSSGTTGTTRAMSYGGDANTAPIAAVNDTGERALINSFDFTTTAWGVNANLTSGDISQDLSFWNQTSDSLGMRTTNATYPVLTFADRVVKFYFASDVKKIQGYTGQGLEYFNVTELAVSRDFAGGNYGLFNTSYLYQPAYYSGYLTVFTYGPSGLDPSTSVNMTLVTPDPLDPHLLAYPERDVRPVSTGCPRLREGPLSRLFRRHEPEARELRGREVGLPAQRHQPGYAERDADAHPIHHGAAGRREATPTRYRSPFRRSRSTAP